MSKLRPRYALKNWPLYATEDRLLLSDCIEILPYLKTQAKIAKNLALWDDKKTKKLLRAIKKRKIWHAFVFFPMIIAAFISVIIFLSALACIFSGNKCAANYGQYINLSFGVAALITAALYLLAQSISRYNDDVIFSDYLSSDLSPKQRKNAIKGILEVKGEMVQLFEVANYETLRRIPKISWKAENWFLLPTENEADRRGIWLNGIYPKGKIYVQKIDVMPQAETDTHSGKNPPIQYMRTNPILEEMRTAHLDGTIAKLRRALTRPQVLILDDFGVAPITEPEKEDLFELLEARTDVGSTLITGQLSPSEWYTYLSAGHLADAIMDRIIQRSHSIELKGKSLRTRLG